MKTEMTAIVKFLQMERDNLDLAIQALSHITGAQDLQVNAPENEEAPVRRTRRRKRSAESIRKQIATRAANQRRKARVNGSGKEASA